MAKRFALSSDGTELKAFDEDKYDPSTIEKDGYKTLPNIYFSKDQSVARLYNPKTNDIEDVPVADFHKALSSGYELPNAGEVVQKLRDQGYTPHRSATEQFASFATRALDAVAAGIPQTAMSVSNGQNLEANVQDYIKSNGKRSLMDVFNNSHVLTDAEKIDAQATLALGSSDIAGEFGELVGSIIPFAAAGKAVGLGTKVLTKVAPRVVERAGASIAGRVGGAVAREAATAMLAEAPKAGILAATGHGDEAGELLAHSAMFGGAFGLLGGVGGEVGRGFGKLGEKLGASDLGGQIKAGVNRMAGLEENQALQIARDSSAQYKSNAKRIHSYGSEEQFGADTAELGLQRQVVNGELEPRQAHYDRIREAQQPIHERVKQMEEQSSEMISSRDVYKAFEEAQTKMDRFSSNTKARTEFGKMVKEFEMNNRQAALSRVDESLLMDLQKSLTAANESTRIVDEALATGKIKLRDYSELRKNVHKFLPKDYLDEISGLATEHPDTYSNLFTRNATKDFGWRDMTVRDVTQETQELHKLYKMKTFADMTEPLQHAERVLQDVRGQAMERTFGGIDTPEFQDYLKARKQAQLVQILEANAKQHLTSALANRKEPFTTAVLTGNAGKSVGAFAGSALGGPVGAAVGASIGATVDALGITTNAARRFGERVRGARMAGTDHPIIAMVNSVLGDGKTTLQTKIDSLLSNHSTVKKIGVPSLRSLAQTLGGKASKSDEDNIKTIRSKLDTLSQNLDEQLGLKYIPDQALAMSIKQNAQKMIGYLNNELAQTDNKIDDAATTLFGGKPRTLEAKKVSSFARKADVVINPFVVLDYAKAGTLTSDHINALQAVYPQLYSAMKDGILMNAKKIKDPQRRNKIQQLFSGAVSSGPPVQQYFSGAPQPKQQLKKSSGSSVGSYQTPAQRLQSKQ